MPSESCSEEDPSSSSSPAPSSPGSAKAPAGATDLESQPRAAAVEHSRVGRSAHLASAEPRKRKRDLRAKRSAKPSSGEENEGGDFILNTEALQGRWRHSSPALGMFVVKGLDVKFDNGSAHRIIEGADGSLSMLGWNALRERSNAQCIVWSKDSMVCSWHFEDDAEVLEQSVDGEINLKNIIQGKRRRAQVDYKALDRQLPQEEIFGGKRRKDWRSDESDQKGENSDEHGDAEEAEEGMSSKDWSELHAKKVRQAAKLFEKWLLSTRTPHHEERLRRRGSLATTIPVNFTGVGQQMIEKELLVYGVQVAHREAGTIVSIGAAGRSRFKERNAELWQTPLPTPRLAAPEGAPSVVRSPEAVANPRSEKEAAALDTPTAQASLRSAEGDAEEFSCRQIQKVQALLNAKPAAEKALALLAELADMQVDSAVLERTKIGITVNQMRKTYAQEAKVVVAAKDLVERWRRLWQLQRQRNSVQA